MIVLGLDTGFAALGWALVDVRLGRVPLVIGVGVWTTEREAKKRQLHVGSDDARRIDFLADRLLESLTPNDVGRQPALVAYELPGGAARGYRAAHSLGLAHALVRTALRAHSVYPVVEVTAHDVKRRLTGDRSAKKPDMIRAAEELGASFRGIRADEHEHAADAVGVALTGAETQIGRALLAGAVA